MKCPACKHSLREKNAGGITLDVCYGGCGGIWFDAAELERVNGRSAATLHSIWQLQSSTPKFADVRVCPRCPEQVLERKWFSDSKKVEIDQCRKCGGVWLDDGEFSLICDEIRVAKLPPAGWAAAMADAATAIRDTTPKRQP